MNIQDRMPTTAEEFLRWNQYRQGKREFVNGKVVEMMSNVTRNHALIATNLLVVLRKALDHAVYDVGSADFGVRSPDGIRYPDVYVDKRSAQSMGTDLAATAPVLVAEVLSPSSLDRDFIEKLQDYQGIGSLRHYLSLSHETVHAWLWTRTAGGDVVGPVEIRQGELLNISGLGIAVPISDVYLGIEFARR